MKKRRTSTLPKNLQKKTIPLAAHIFWNFVDCIQLASTGFKYQFIPTLPYNDVVFQCNFIFNFLIQYKNMKLNEIKVGSLVAFVFTSKHNQFFPIMEKKIEIQSSKVRTFFGHVIQCRLKKNNTSILLRICLAGDFFLFRIFPYAPNIISFFVIKNYTGNFRSMFKFKVKKHQKALRKSRIGNI